MYALFDGVGIIRRIVAPYILHRRRNGANWCVDETHGAVANAQRVLSTRLVHESRTNDKNAGPSVYGSCTGSQELVKNNGQKSKKSRKWSILTPRVVRVLNGPLFSTIFEYF